MEERPSRGILTSPTSNLSIGAIFREGCGFALLGCKHLRREIKHGVDVSKAKCGFSTDEDSEVVIAGWNEALPLPPNAKLPYCNKHNF